MSSAMESSARNGDVMQDMNLAEDQIKVLEENFLKVSKQPDEATLMLIAAECGLSEDDTAWECKTDMDTAYRFGTIEVSCEGYNYPDDPYVLKGSCGMEYTLELTEHGKQNRKSSYGSGGFSSGFFQGSPNNINSQTPSDASALIIIAILLLFAYGVYKMFLCGPLRGQQHFPNDDYPNTHTHDYQSGPHTMGPPPPGFKPDYMGNTGYTSNAGYTGASAGFESTGNEYGFANNFARPHNNANSRPGFWTGMGTGGVLGYMFGSQRCFYIYTLLRSD
ncbi:Store-operated calcium entry-associated regulatory factor [Acipenser ruthenus]|uniref:Store-operated calcium entry-associated regulatory factor n=1 Tax=Acipenser ruthenus TaxID=7906 RepID=A0A444TW77_ACIRT|nr:Store-operated calcium entry-associated regulatory factor [Acipenser ruthenus]